MTDHGRFLIPNEKAKFLPASFMLITVDGPLGRMSNLLNRPYAVPGRVSDDFHHRSPGLT
jgi:hypothetical protein